MAENYVTNIFIAKKKQETNVYIILEGSVCCHDFDKCAGSSWSIGQIFGCIGEENERYFYYVRAE